MKHAMPIHSICILRLSAIGDVCNAVAAVQAIQRAYPAASITWVIGKLEFSLLEGLPGVEFVVFDKSLGKVAFKQFRAQFKHRRFDVLLHMQVAFRANWLSRLIKAKRKIGFDKQRAKELHGAFINERIKAQHEPHVLQGFYAFAEAIGVEESAVASPSWHIPLSDAEQNFADTHIAPKSRTLVICPSASKAERNWLADRYAKLAEHAHQQGFQIVLSGGPGKLERDLADEIIQHAKIELQDLTGKTSLKQMLALLGNASIVVAPDTGPAHMANTQGTPVLGLYGHANPKRTGPYAYQHYVVEAYHANLRAQTGKTASELPWGTRVKGEAIMADISVAEVCARFDQMVADFSL